MKRILGSLFTAALFSVLTLPARANDQNKNTNQNQNQKTTGSYESKTTNTTTTDAGTAKTTTDTVYGKVEEYTPGKSITISTPGKTEGTKSYDLTNKDVAYHVASNVKTGEWVSVTQKTDKNGKKMTTIARSKHAARQQ